MKHHSLVQISLFFKKTKFALLKSNYFHFKTPNTQKSVFFKTKPGKSLIWQRGSALTFNSNSMSLYAKQLDCL